LNILTKEESVGEKRVLIIDDEIVFTQALKNGLERTGKYRVRVENEGALGVNAAKEFAPDIIFLDIVMPDMNGDDVAIELQNFSATKYIPIVFLTAIVTKDEIADSGSLIGTHQFLPKPVTLEQIMECIEKSTH
jgi:CheY-like chemotaxis protein